MTVKKISPGADVQALRQRVDWGHRMHHTEPMDVLLLEPSPAEARRLRQLLADEAQGGCRLNYAHDLDTAVKRLAFGRVDAILFDLSGPARSGQAAFEALRSAAKDVPIVVLAEREDEADAKTAVARGAKDYLIKNHMDASALYSALRYAVALRRGAAAQRI